MYYAYFALAFFGSVFSIIIAVSLLRKASTRASVVAKDFDRGIAGFIAAGGMSNLLFYVDRLILFLTNNRWLESYSPDVSFLNRDYFFVILIFLLISATFLYRVIERYLQNREKTPLTKFMGVLILPMILMRVIENLAGMYAGLVILVLVGLAILISFGTIIGQYLKLGIQAPKGSDVRRKSLMCTFGVLLWASIALLSLNIAEMKFDVFGLTRFNMLAPVGPFIYILSQIMVVKGFSRAE
jgi:hypothetical protein